MSDDPFNNRPDGPNRRNQDPQFNWRGFMLFALAITLLISGFMMNKGLASSRKAFTYAEFKKHVEADLIDSNKPLELITSDATTKQVIQGSYFPMPASITPPAGAAGDTEPEAPSLSKPVLSEPAKDITEKPAFEASKSESKDFSVQVNIDFQKEELHKLLDAHKLVLTPKVENEMWSSLIGFLLPLLVILAFFYFLVRQQLRSAGRGAMSFGKSKAKMLAQDRNKVTFKDVAGVEEAKEEVQEIVEFLKDPKKFQRLGGKIPKGVLMTGPPGTGKTLLAKAIAGEADVPFFSISGSDFVEMFVGVGASRVRDMFEQGKKNAPCLIFIDEIDAVGRHRGHGMGGGHDEREQTLNALLVEMDGFDTQEGIIIIAATNRADVLDPALLRPGRFDRQVTVNLPDVKGREEILRVHAKKVKLSDGADLSKIARGTPGFSGAELANLLNEAALLAARRNMKSITNPELEEARDKVRWGRERRSMALTEKEKENTAYHEAGHAILNEVLEHTDPLHKVTIIPRGPTLGVTMMLPEEDKFTHRKSELIDNLIVTMGGRVAEEIQFGDVTSGASGDIRMASRIARSMICSWGMSTKLGMIEYGENESTSFMGRGSSNYSEDTAQKIDEEVKRLIDEAYDKAKEVLLKYMDKLDALAHALLEYETLDGAHIKEIMAHGRLINPPENKSKPPPPPPLPKASDSRPVKREDEDDGGMAPGLTGVPA
ncbi:ATP-dependent zinc metalloprotease FtsH [Prosthecobacter sp.]|uniref:ATP-dependent zinc metalloprotease FtsH n=1 Tax=Prosthecobacter sp. TaxID=1965333 RepID=UPI0025D09AA6|nr:ATP-dependent zinc metalloprotease FtsH [Prosthecobacter sp.]